MWSTAATPGTVNINVADIDELTADFDEIGTMLAQVIVNYRRQCGDVGIIVELVRIYDIGLTILKDSPGVIAVMHPLLQTQIYVTSD